MGNPVDSRLGLGLVLTLFTAFFVDATAHAEDELLVDDLSRGDLAIYALTEFDGERALPLMFHFPDHVPSGQVFGIDVSHHQGRIDWAKAANQKVSFVYIKATQGSRYKDGEFARNWNSTAGLVNGKIPIIRGAYHFMSALDDAIPQAKNFSNTVGKLRKSDLPPCLDLEWDFKIDHGRVVRGDGGKPVDRWEELAPDQIAEKAAVWLQEVQGATGKKPIIYTNFHWWQARVGKAGDKLSGYKIWIADYSRKSLDAEKPQHIEGSKGVLWQLSDRGAVPGIGNSVDTNRILDKSATLESIFSN
ncbi:hypothetical protein CO660_12240 [Rhizobium sp. L9]|uniref:GH25 family lysozyme n=1 Tax=Rhizobium sp. L9 TaxID=1340738 RepID=UPI000BE7D1EC|nr:GH25 family lysozyme [Rhizobium sp. L9]PDT29665.1 hypothetical protein CO660_12240 [Rhizobium sp. L9]